MELDFVRGKMSPFACAWCGRFVKPDVVSTGKKYFQDDEGYVYCSTDHRLRGPSPHDPRMWSDKRTIAVLLRVLQKMRYGAAVLSEFDWEMLKYFEECYHQFLYGEDIDALVESVRREYQAARP
jgi:hypothetical protein